MTVARLTQLTTLSWLAATCMSVFLAWHRPSTGSFVLVVLLTTAHAWILGVEFCAINGLNKKDKAPAATRGELLTAWWNEVILVMQVFAWRQPFCSTAQPDFFAQNQQRGVVLVHGFCCNRALWNPWIKSLRERGHTCVAVNLEPVFGSIDDYTNTIEAAMRLVRQTTGTAPLLVGHSMGGLAIRAWLRAAIPGSPNVAHVVTIGSPHHGTWLGRFSHVKNGKQMRLLSAWLAQLESDEAQARENRLLNSMDLPPLPNLTCWYSNADNIVLPASTATLAHADNRLARGVAHLALAFHPPIFKHCVHLLTHAGHVEPPES